MRAPLALGILTWDDVLAGFSVPNFWAEKNLPRGGGERRIQPASNHAKCTREQISSLITARIGINAARGESHPCAERIFYDSTDV